MNMAISGGWTDLPKAGQEGREMAQWVKAIVTKSDDRSLIPRIHVMEGEKTHKSYPLASTYVL